jgi:very-short-patch-repair endonuclease
MRGEIIRALSLSSNGLSLAEVALSVGQPDLMKVSKNLSDLQHERVVEIIGGKFRLSGSGRKAIAKGTVSVTVPKSNEPSSETPRMATTGVPRPQTIRVAALILHAAHTREREDAPSRSPDGDAINQAALLEYYAECLKVEEKVDASSPFDGIDKRFVAARLTDEWWPASGRTTKLYAPILLLPDGFQETLARSRQSDILHLGYPLDVFPISDGSFWVNAIGTYAFRWKSDGQNRIELEAIDRTYVLNPNWLKAQKQFIDVAGLLKKMGASDFDIDDEDEPSVTASIDIEDMCSVLNLAFAKRKTEDISPRRMAADLRAEKGIQNVAALFAVSKTRYSERAISDVKSMVDLSRRNGLVFSDTSLGTLLGQRRVASDDRVPVLEPISLTSAQLDATRKALRDPLTVITGPPGTGKSQVVSAIIASAVMAGKSVFFASRNHAAIDAVEDRTREVSPNRALLLRLNKKFGQGQPLSIDKIVSDLVARPLTRPDIAGVERQVEALSGLDRKREEEIARAREVSQLRKTLEDLEAALESRLSYLDKDPEDVRRLPAPPDRIGDGKTETPLSRLVRAIRCVIDRLLGRVMRTHPDWVEAGCPPEDGDRQREWLKALANARSLLDEIPNLLAHLPSDDEQATLGRKIADLNQKIATEGARLCQVVLSALDYCNEDDRALLMELRGKLSGAKVSAEEARLVLKHYPVWACSNLVVSKFAPLAPALFDYLIIDEASQCDIASAMPLFARAKRAVVVGDPMQLKAVSKLSRDWEVDTLQNKGLAATASIGRFRQSMNSLFDLASTTTGASRSMLIDHFRCHPAIADYVGAFYNGELLVRTDEAGLRHHPGMKPGFAWVDVVGEVKAAQSGSYCDAERDVILDAIKELERSEYRGTIGVCTPFRTQATRISDRIAEFSSPEFVDRARLIAQTAHGFQGDARDVIFFSLCLGPGSPPGSIAFLREGGNLFNVAVSRAKAVCRVVGNREAARSSGIPHVARLVTACEAKSRNQGANPVFESPWEERLYAALKANGVECTTQYPIAGRRLDLAWFGKGNLKIDIEVDGDRYHRDASGMRKVDDIWRDYQLRSLGWKVIRFWVYELRDDMNRCVERVKGAIDEAA